jgi:hypothetical protein
MKALASLRQDSTGGGEAQVARLRCPAAPPTPDTVGQEFWGGLPHCQARSPRLRVSVNANNQLAAEPDLWPLCFLLLSRMLFHCHKEM